MSSKFRTNRPLQRISFWSTALLLCVSALETACVADTALGDGALTGEGAAGSPVVAPQRLARTSEDAAIISELEAQADANINADWIDGITTNSVDMYFRWPGMDGLVDLYRATGKREYLDLAVEMGRRYVELGQECF